MPLTAIHDGSDELHFIQQVSPRETYLCPECREELSYTRSHIRNLSNGTEARVRAHFRHRPSDQCTRSGGGGGGGGESDIHKERKRDLLAEAMYRFECSDWAIEEEIGDHIADALVVFKDPHEEYGKGLALEYQHKNEGKDIRDVEVDYARNGFTTVWAWEDQFDYSTNIPKIDLFGGRVCTPWPECVPHQSDWWEPPHNYKTKQKSWEQAFEQGLCTSGAPATLPREWCDEASRKIWENQDWDDLFAQVSDAPSDFIGDYSARSAFEHPENFITHVRETLDDAQVDIDIFHMLPEDLVFKWYCLGLDSREDTVKRLPSPDSWGGTLDQSISPTPPELDVQMPPEFFEKHRESLRLRWEYGSGNLDMDVVHNLAATNAPRNCAVCGERASYYLLKNDVLSEYQCETHAAEMVSIRPTD